MAVTQQKLSNVRSDPCSCPSPPRRLTGAHPHCPRRWGGPVFRSYKGDPGDDRQSSRGTDRRVYRVRGQRRRALDLRQVSPESLCSHGAWQRRPRLGAWTPSAGRQRPCWACEDAGSRWEGTWAWHSGLGKPSTGTRQCQAASGKQVRGGALGVWACPAGQGDSI